jgi:hypothetical protein
MGGSDYACGTAHAADANAVDCAVRLATGMTTGKLPSIACVAFRLISLIPPL